VFFGFCLWGVFFFFGFLFFCFIFAGVVGGFWCLGFGFGFGGLGFGVRHFRISGVGVGV